MSDAMGHEPAKGTEPKAGSLTLGLRDLGKGVRPVVVYLPAGWPQVRPRRALYLLHGAGYDGATALGTEGDETDLKLRIDELVSSGAVEPMMVVSPTYSDARTKQDAVRELSGMKGFLRNLVDYAEGTYGRVGRESRMLAGFSLGAICAWESLLAPELFSTVVPVAGDCWAFGPDGGLLFPLETASRLMRGFRESNQTVVRAYCGENDTSSLAAMRAQIGAMREMGRLGDAELSLHVLAGHDHTNEAFAAAVLDALGHPS